MFGRAAAIIRHFANKSAVGFLLFLPKLKRGPKQSLRILVKKNPLPVIMNDVGGVAVCEAR